jgi:hypothetical protein
MGSLLFEKPPVKDQNWLFDFSYTYTVISSAVIKLQKERTSQQGN